MDPTFASKILHYAPPSAGSPEWRTMRDRLGPPFSAEEIALQTIIFGGSLDEIRPILLRLHRAVNVVLPRREWDILTRARGQRLDLVAKLHEAWSAAQIQIARLQLIVESSSSVFRDSRKQARAEGKKEAAKQFSNHLTRNEAIMEMLRDAADMLAWGTIAHLQHVANRLHRLQKPHLPSEAKLAEYLQCAEDIRADEPEKFVLLADLGTLVNVGDLVTIAAVTPPIRIEFVELKTGKIPEPARIREAGETPADLPTKDAKHQERFQRQQETLEDVRDILGTDSGYDRSYGARIELHDPPSEPRSWTREILDAVTSVGTGQVIRFHVDGALLVQVSRGVPEPGEALSDYCKARGISAGPTLSLRQKSTTALAGSLLGDVFEPGHAIDILLGHIVVLAHVSVSDFIEQLRKTGLAAGLATRSETEKIKKMHPTWRPFAWKNQAVFYGVGEHLMHLGDMWLIRMALGYVTPSSIAEWLADGAKRAAARDPREYV